MKNLHNFALSNKKRTVMNNSEIVKKTSCILTNNKEEWERIYAGYAKSVVQNKTKYGNHSRCF